MKIKVFKLYFKNYLHSGAIGFQEEEIIFPGSDTIFAAVANAIVELDGVKTLKEFCESNPRFSSTFPFYKEKYFLPNHFAWKDVEKSIKKAKWIEKEIVEKGIKDGLKVTNSFVSKEKLSKIYEEVEITKNTKDRIKETTTIYTVRAFSFKEDSGLYFAYIGNFDISQALEYLGEIGMGGYRSIGFGRFKVKSDKINWKNHGNYGLLISKYLPKKEEISKIKQGIYRIEERGGWTESKRKKRIKVLAEGSIIPVDVEGCLIKSDIYRNYLAFILPLGWYS